MVHACQQEYDRVMSVMKRKHRFNYECTFDAFMMLDGEISCRLIEINSESFGWGPAGASLFSWLHRPPPQVDEPALYLVAGTY